MWSKLASEKVDPSVRWDEAVVWASPFVYSCAAELPLCPAASSLSCKAIGLGFDFAHNDRRCGIVEELLAYQPNSRDQKLVLID
jgi:hypothetical protein